MALAAFAATLRRLWRVRWEPEHKEALWRLAVHGVPLFARFAPAACGCAAVVGADPDPRLHYFWECPVARAVRAQLCLGAGVEVVRAQLWLVQAPARLAAEVWDVVCLAALSAMEFGRRRLSAGGGPRWGVGRGRGGRCRC